MISACVIAKNAASLLPSCLSSLPKSIADIVVVVDAETIDDTAQIAKKFGARVYVRPLDNFASQKNFAATKAQHDWVLFLDADEQMSSQLATEIGSLSFTASAYRMPRLNYIFGKAIYHTNWDPHSDTHIWLYDKKVCSWQGDVHEEVAAAGKVETLVSPKIHYPYRDVADFVAKLNHYTSLEIKPANPFFDFLRRYLWHLGFLDGWHGLFLSYLMFIYHTVAWVKIWQKTHVSG